MNLQRITRVHVLIAAGAVAAGIAVLFSLLLIQPKIKSVRRALQSAAENEEWVRTEGPRTEKQLAAARKRAAQVKVKYDELMEKRMPKIDRSDPVGLMVRLWDFPREEGQLMERWFAGSGAQVSGVSYPAFGTSLDQLSGQMFPPLNWNLGVEVKGFPSLLEWLQKLPQAPRFMVVQSVSMQGPRAPGEPLRASVPVILYMWTGEPQVAAAPAAGAEEGVAPAAGRGMMGRGRGARGGMMGAGARGGRMRAGRGPMGGGMRGGRGPMGGGMRGGRGPTGGGAGRAGGAGM